MEQQAGALMPGQARDAGHPEVGDVRHGFQLGQHRLLLAEGTFAELASKTAICGLPDTPDWFAGFINHRGHTVPVYDLSQLLGFGATDLSRQFWILLLDRQPSTLGILLRQLPAAISNPEPMPSEGEEALPEPLASSVSARYQVDQQLWIELDHHALIGHMKSSFRDAAGPAATKSKQNKELS